MQEFIHLMSSPANAKRLMQALEDVENGKGIEMTLEQFISGNWPVAADAALQS